MNKIRILHCLETVGSGGVEQRRLHLASQLDPDKYEQALLCTKAVGGLPERFKEVDCKVYEVGELKGIVNWACYVNGLKVIKEFKPHIVHGAVFEGVTLSVILGILGRVPVIVGEETSDPVNRRWKGHLLYRLLAALTHKMVAVSPSVDDYLSNVLHVNKNKVVLINNGVPDYAGDIGGGSPLSKEDLGIGNETLVIGCVGRLLDDHKRISDLLKGFALVLDTHEDLCLLIIGDGPDRPALMTLSDTLGIKAKVKFLGYQGDPQPYYRIMDMFALVSSREAFGLVIVEAMLASLPIVATRVGGIPYIVRDGVSGILIPPDRPNAIANALGKLILDPGLRQKMGKRGREIALEKFSIERYVGEVGDLYQELFLKYRGS